MTRLRGLALAVFALALAGFVAIPGSASAASFHRAAHHCTHWREVGSAKDRRFRTCASIYTVNRNGYPYGYSQGTVQAQYQTRPDGTWHADTHRVSIGATTIWDSHRKYESGAFNGKGKSVFRSPTRLCRYDVSVSVRGIYGSTLNQNFQDFNLHAYC